MATQTRTSDTMIGRDYFCAPNLEELVQSTKDTGFHFACVPLAHPRLERQFIGGKMAREGPWTRSDLTLPQQDWTAFVVGKVSGWIDVDSPVENHRQNSIEALAQELAWASHLILPAVCVELRGLNCVNLASYLAPALSGHSQYWLKVPLSSSASAKESASGRPSSDPWEWWDTCRTLCDNSRSLGVALVVSADLPAPNQVARWLGEPIKALFVPTSIFLTNPKGYPVLSKAHQAVVKSLLKNRPQLVVTGSAKHAQGIEAYLRYLNHLEKTIPEAGPVEAFAQGYEDQLQSPLQPLKDNLESSTYETFELDPVKYAQYQLAVYRALIDRVPEEEKDTTTVVLMVVGAGRGPLVRCSLRAANDAQRNIRVYAVEKNPNAVVTLQNMQQEEWGSLVTVVSSDMRTWDAPEKADILVSELLGSFGDNELSPECLDGAQKFLKEDGISIPASYTSYLAPMSSCKLHANVVAMDATTKGLHTPYVVLIKQAHIMSTIQDCFVFEHPNPDCETEAGPDNNRYKSMVFEIEEACTMHGFAGYFDSVLYDDVMISIHPDTHSPGMFSWFPIYFPIDKPMYCPKGCKVEVHFWRKGDKSRVWYEWAVVSPAVRRVHNLNGVASSIGL